MTETLSTEDRGRIDVIIRALEAAWNAGDGDAFAAPFAIDADFVTVRGEHSRGRPAIAAGHAGIFRTIYAGSVIRLAVETVRLLRPDVALAHCDSNLEAPTGPMAGRHQAHFSLVLLRGASGWEIASFHNTIRVQGRPE